MMKEKEIMDRMQRDIEIPDIVEQKAQEAFQIIQRGGRKSGENREVVVICPDKRPAKRKWKTVWLAVAAAALAVGTTVCAAAYIHWSRGLKAELQMTAEEKQLLEEQGYMSPILDNHNAEISTESGRNGNSTASGGAAADGMAQGVTAQGITITPLEMIADERFAWLSFKVEGYDLAEGKEPCFDGVGIVIDDNPNAVISHYSQFYDGICYDGGSFYYEDGTSALDADGNIVGKYVNEEGYMEYIIEIVGINYEKGLTNSSLHVTFEDLGTVYKADFTGDIEASWEFDIDLKGSDKVRKVALDAPLGESGATVIYAEISPISLHVEYDFPLQMEPIEAIHQDGEKVMTSTFVDAPYLLGVRLKDGTLLTQLMNGGGSGYADGNEDIYYVSYATSRVIDPAQVDALLFQKSEPEVDENRHYQWKEENMYIVPIE
ncbi:MAG: DUF4179 domain-containing protein [Clostridium sp.]|nr:DUF4179 domain-containing protein [Clostridium sp.]